MSTPSSKTILVINDEKQPTSPITSILKEINYEVSQVANEKEGTSWLQSTKADLLLLLPRPSLTPSFLQVLRKTKGGQSAKFVVWAASQDLEGKLKSMLGKKGGIDSVVPDNSSVEDVIDWIERLIGLPPPPNGNREGATAASVPFATPGKKESADVRELQREVESLQEQVHFYQQQLDQISVVGEKETREIDQVLKELQEKVEVLDRENQQIKEELKFLQSDLAKKDRDLSDKEKLLGNLHEEAFRETSQLKTEIESLRNTMADGKEQHKKAQNALRDYYKAKMDKQAKHEKTIRSMEERLSELTDSLATTRRKAEDAESVNRDLMEANEDLTSSVEKMEQELKTEKQRARKAKEALAQLSKVLE